MYNVRWRLEIEAIVSALLESLLPVSDPISLCWHLKIEFDTHRVLDARYEIQL